MHRRWKKKMLYSLCCIVALVVGSCCFQIYLTDKSLFDVCTDEDKCEKKEAEKKSEFNKIENLPVDRVHDPKIAKHKRKGSPNDIDDESVAKDISVFRQGVSNNKPTDQSSTPSTTTTVPSIRYKTQETTSEPKIISRVTEVPTEIISLDKKDGKIEPKTVNRHEPYFPNLPKILWWDFYSYGPRKYNNITCKHDVKCHVVSERNFSRHPDTMAIIHYGTHIDFKDLPTTRNPNIIWGLIHEESMKNADYLFNHEEILSLFNYTSTFKRESDYPITTHFLPSLDYLQSKKYLVSVQDKNRHKEEENLAPIFYIQSDCGVPSNRDKYVELLQKYIRVDSYGRCNNNKKLPSHLTFEKSMQPMLDKEFYELGAKYKFTLAMENAACDDYITEKIWRPLYLGSVPIIFGSPKIKDFLPNPKSAIVINDFNITDLATLINYLDKNDTAYQEYLQFKEPGGITNGYLVNVVNTRDWSKNSDFSNSFYSFFTGFECFICEQIHKVLEAKKNGQTLTKVAKLNHYGCPAPKMFSESGLYTVNDKRFSYHYYEAKYRAKAFRFFYDNNLNFTEQSINELAASFRKELEELN